MFPRRLVMLLDYNKWLVCKCIVISCIIAHDITEVITTFVAYKYYFKLYAMHDFHVMWFNDIACLL